MDQVNSPRKEAARARRIELERVKALERQAYKKAFWQSDIGKEITSEARSAQYAMDAEYRDKVLASNKRWNQEHREENSARTREYYRNNPGVVAARVKQWKLDNPEAAKIQDARRAHRRRDREGKTRCDLKAREWKLILEIQDNRCAHCGREFGPELKPTKDHIIPVSRGGGLTFENTCALCASCNSMKRDKIEFALPYLKR